MNPAGHTRRNLAICIAALIASTLLTYWPVLKNEFINYDDPDYVTTNEVVQKGLTAEGFKWAFTTGHASNWHPVTWLSHMADVSMFGMKPAGHHATNLFFHVTNSVLLLMLLWLMTGSVWRSAMVAALFALHPLHVESVAWVAERKDVLSAFFGILTLMAYAHYAVESKDSGLKSKVWYGVALGLFALGLMSKPMLVTWPFVMLLLDFWPLGRATAEDGRWRTEIGTVWKRLVLEKLPFMALVIASSIATVIVQKSGGAVTTAINLPVEDRLANAVASYLKYLGKTICPTDLAIFYPHPEIRYPISSQWPTWIIALGTLGLVTVSILVIRQAKSRPFLVSGWFWYLGTLVPVIGIVQVGTQAMADRYTYIPLIGIFIGIMWMLAGMTNRNPSGRRLAIGASVVAISLCVVATRLQLPYWRDSFSIFQHAVNVTAHNAPALANLGTEYIKRGEYDQAVRLFDAALEADPHFANANYSLGLIAQKLGKGDEAASQYRKAIQIQPDHVLARHNLGLVLWLQGKPAEAETEFLEALRTTPDFSEANLNLGNLLLEEGRPQEGQTFFKTALQNKPDSTTAQMGLALALKMQGRLTEAEIELRNIVRINPEHQEAILNLGVVLVDSGQTNEAATYLNQISRLNPGIRDELFAAGKELFALGKNAAAEDRFAAAAHLNPTNSIILEHLGLLRAQGGKLDSAAALYTRALKQRPSAESYYYLAMIQGIQGQVANTLTNLSLAVAMKPDYLVALNELAWVLATHPQQEFRDGKRAVELAERTTAASGDAEPRYWGSLDAAYAESGRFEDAIKTAQKVIVLANEKGQTNLISSAELRIKLYQQGKPFRQ